jgi:hypothetical protein
MIITIEEYLMGRDAQYPITEQMRTDALVLIAKVNLLLWHFGEPRRVNSGYRPAPINARVRGASKKSLHIFCRAVDLADEDERLDNFCIDNVPLLEKIGLWIESKEVTPRWCHMQTVEPRSKNRFFAP